MPAPTPAVVARLRALLEDIGKVPVVCGAAPGYIVPRLQALIMNEAARMIEEGVATAEEIDKATRYGLGLRFAAHRRGRVHRLRRQRHPVLREPRSWRSALEPRALHGAGHRRPPDATRAASG